MSYPFDTSSLGDKPTAINVVLTHLQSGRDITQRLAWEDYHISRLAAVINDLKRKGVAIASEWLTVSSPYGKTRVKRYFLGVYGGADL
jgi:hypothetical protein